MTRRILITDVTASGTQAPQQAVLPENTTTFLIGDGTFTAPDFTNGANTGSSATPATTGTMTVPMDSAVKTITPTGACTFNATGGVIGQIVTFSITTAGTSSFVLTFGTNFRKIGTLATGTVSARFFAVTFRCVAANTWSEIARTAVQS